MLTNPELLRIFSKLMAVCLMFTNCMQVCLSSGTDETEQLQKQTQLQLIGSATFSIFPTLEGAPDCKVHGHGLVFFFKPFPSFPERKLYRVNVKCRMKKMEISYFKRGSHSGYISYKHVL